ncbi:MAG: type II toxin-antitoxin system Phd/YefM family antitoxin [Kiritimatiellaeota bacterium]|nr:type II toxin-antitoxin system Phd/YefM family antitoxin [Kiritimatiellota bacterium]
MTTMTFVQARNGLDEALNRVCYGGERILIARRGKPVAALVSADELEVLQRIEDAEDLRDARKALAAYKRNPKSAIPYDEFRRKLGLV